MTPSVKGDFSCSPISLSCRFKTQDPLCITCLFTSLSPVISQFLDIQSNGKSHISQLTAQHRKTSKVVLRVICISRSVHTKLKKFHILSLHHLTSSFPIFAKLQKLQRFDSPKKILQNMGADFCFCWWVLAKNLRGGGHCCWTNYDQHLFWTEQMTKINHYLGCPGQFEMVGNPSHNEHFLYTSPTCAHTDTCTCSLS